MLQPTHTVCHMLRHLWRDVVHQAFSLAGRNSRLSAIRICRHLAGEAAQPPKTERILSDVGTLEKTLNHVTLIGRVGGEPQKRGTEQHPVVIFSLATHTNYKYESGEFAQKTDWHRICVFKPGLRDMVYSFLKKGQRVHISGKISYGSVTEDTVLKPTTSIIADDIIFFNSGES